MTDTPIETQTPPENPQPFFPTDPQEFNKYIYDCSEGLVTILCIVRNAVTGGQYIVYSNQLQEIFTRPIASFNPENFGIVLTVDDLATINTNIKNFRGLTTFTDSFNSIHTSPQTTPDTQPE